MNSLPEDGRPYFLTDSVTLAASTAGTLSLEIGTGEEFYATHVMFAATSVAFSVTSMVDESNIPFTNADADDPLTGSMFPGTNTSLQEWLALPTPLKIEGGGKLSINVTDTSASQNIVRVVLLGVRRVI